MSKWIRDHHDQFEQPAQKPFERAFVDLDEKKKKKKKKKKKITLESSSIISRPPRARHDIDLAHPKRDTLALGCVVSWTCYETNACQSCSIRRSDATHCVVASGCHSGAARSMRIGMNVWSWIRFVSSVEISTPLPLKLLAKLWMHMLHPVVDDLNKHVLASRYLPSRWCVDDRQMPLLRKEGIGGKTPRQRSKQSQHQKHHSSKLLYTAAQFSAESKVSRALEFERAC
jgi:hypothetical protein